MSYDLILGDYAYSSWSLRGWLLFERFGLTATTRQVDFLSDIPVADQLAALGLTARTVPTLVTPEGAVIGESLAIAEELASRHPEAGLWPEDPKARAVARALTAEMHSGFMALRSHCPMNLRVAYRDADLPAEVMGDIARIEEIWAAARAEFASNGPWLCGRYSVADVFYAPVAARIAGYGLSVGKDAADYVALHLADPAFRRWRALGLVVGPDLPWYARDYPRTDWPGPAPLPARAVDSGQAENDRCPYSGKPVSDLLEIDGRIIGFCNPTCRDKTVADPEAWPRFMEIYQS